MKQYELKEYMTANGKKPFREWFENLRDNIARAKIIARVDRAAYGNFGNWKDIKGAKGVFEMLDHYGPGYRIFYTVKGKKLILLLAGSTKKDQKKALAKAIQYLADYEERTKQ